MKNYAVTVWYEYSGYKVYEVSIEAASPEQASELVREKLNDDRTDTGELLGEELKDDREGFFSVWGVEEKVKFNGAIGVGAIEEVEE